MSAQPQPHASPQPRRKPLTSRDILLRKGGDPLVCLTAYDAPTAQMLDPHCELLLVGDSVGMVVHGLPSTVGVTVDMMILHGQAVMRGAGSALVVVDMPFGSYEQSPQQAFATASRIMMEVGCGAVKLESGPHAAETVAYLVERGIPVMAHVGLRPQAMHVLGGFRAQGRDADSRRAILEDAKAADNAGAFAIVVEGVTTDVADAATKAVRAPTIGIGAGPVCDGQILVTQDMLGLFEWTPRFVQRYAAMRAMVEEAVVRYADDVRARRFPAAEHEYGRPLASTTSA